MAQNFEHIMQGINNSQLRKSIEDLFEIIGIGTGDNSDSFTMGDITGNVTGDVTGDVLADDTAKIINSGADQANSVVTAGSLVGALTGAATGDVLAADTNTIVDSGATPAASVITAGTAAISAKFSTEATATPVNAVAAEAKLTNSGAIAPATHAVCVLTNDTTNIEEGKIITINTVVYTFKATTTAAYDINIGTDAEESIDFLFAAINASGTGDGTDYHAGTLANDFVVATAENATTLTIQAKLPGTVANAFPTESDDAGWTWDGATMNSGTPGVTTAAATVTIGTRVYTVVDELSETEADAVVDQILYGGDEATVLDNLKLAIAAATPGTEYSTGTVINADVVAGANTNTTQVIAAIISGVIGNAIAIECTWANTDWDDEVTNVMGTETAGVDGTVGVKGEITWDATNIYICLLANTIADANWVQATMATF